MRISLEREIQEILRWNGVDGNKNRRDQAIEGRTERKSAGRDN